MEQKDLEAAVDRFAARLLEEHQKSTEGNPSPWPVIRALLHRAVHLAAGLKGIEFCTLASYLGELVGHAHGLMHGNDPKAPSHGQTVLH